MEQQPDNSSDEQPQAASGNGDDALRVSDRRYWARAQSDDSTDDSDAQPADATLGQPRLPTFVEQLQKRLETNEQRLEEFKETMRQEQAALRERLERDALQQITLAKGEFLQPFLTILDNFDRALASAEEQQTFEALLEGIQMTRQEIERRLEAQGVEQLQTVGQPFDPNVAEAVHLQEVDDAERDGIVLAEFECGYHFGDTILRPAKVQVGKYVQK